MANVKANEKHNDFYNAFNELLQKYASELSAVELLALCANVTGKVLALQDQRVMTSERALDIVFENVVLGNQEQVADMMRESGGLQ